MHHAHLGAGPARWNRECLRVLDDSCRREAFAWLARSPASALAACCGRLGIEPVGGPWGRAALSRGLGPGRPGGGASWATLLEAGTDPPLRGAHPGPELADGGLISSGPGALKPSRCLAY